MQEYHNVWWGEENTFYDKIYLSSVLLRGATEIQDIYICSSEYSFIPAYVVIFLLNSVVYNYIYNVAHIAADNARIICILEK